MCLKIRYDGKSEKFCKIFYELNNALEIAYERDFTLLDRKASHAGAHVSRLRVI